MEAHKRKMGELGGIMNRMMSNEDVIEKLKTAREERKDEFADICPSQKVEMLMDFKQYKVR